MDRSLEISSACKTENDSEASYKKLKAIIRVRMMADSLVRFGLRPPSSAGPSSHEDKADSYNYDTSADLRNGMATTRDGDARHIAMQSIRMREGKSISPINSYAT